MVEWYMNQWTESIPLVGILGGFTIFLAALVNLYGPLTKKDARNMLVVIGFVLLAIPLAPFVMYGVLLAIVGLIVYGLGVLIYTAFKGED